MCYSRDYCQLPPSVFIIYVPEALSIGKSGLGKFRLQNITAKVNTPTGRQKIALMSIYFVMYIAGTCSVRVDESGFCPELADSGQIAV